MGSSTFRPELAGPLADTEEAQAIARRRQPNAEEAAIRWTKNLEAGVKGFREWCEGRITRAQGERRKVFEEVEAVFNIIFPRKRP